ncbi:Heavy-metal-associated domain protein [uncultured archaeon]|nr:Heavy-metal-associated domain protein [uncultured archaeon]
MKDLKLEVKGMHCHSCEMLIEDSLAEVAGVRKVKADHKAGLVRITADDSVNLNAVKKAIVKEGYEVVEE